MQTLYFLLLILITLNSTIAQDLSFTSGLDAYVAKVMKEFEVPGISVAIVKDGKVFLTKGYGIRELSKSAAVDAHTLFGIASNTKAFTATALGLLVEESKLEWDAPVVKYLKWFQLADPYVTREITIRDLLVHRAGFGLGAGDLLWWPPSTYTRKEISERLRYIPLASSFRSKYAYNNVLYLIAGEIIEQISGTPWEDFIQKRILTRVGMTKSNIIHEEYKIEGNIATPHARVGDKIQSVKPFLSSNTNPAGGINSNAEDMAKWMIVQLDSGRLADGSRLFSQKTAKELWTIVTPITISDPPAELSRTRPNFNGYALGFGIRDYRGLKVVSHTGGLPGYLSRLTMIPELKLGITVLTNQESGAAFNAITYFILDYFLKAPTYDWLTAYKRVTERTDSTNKATTRETVLKRDSTSRPSLQLEKYEGVFSDPWYGDIEIAMVGGKLTIKFLHTPLLAGVLEHWQYDTFIARWYDRELRADAYVSFTLKPEGSIDQVFMKAVLPETDFSFDFHDLLFKPAVNK